MVNVLSTLCPTKKVISSGLAAYFIAISKLSHWSFFKLSLHWHWNYQLKYEIPMRGFMDTWILQLLFLLASIIGFNFNFKSNFTISVSLLRYWSVQFSAWSVEVLQFYYSGIIFEKALWRCCWLDALSLVEQHIDNMANYLS